MIDRAEAESDVCPLFQYISRLLDKGMIEKAAEAGLVKYTEMGITSLLESPFRQNATSIIDADIFTGAVSSYTGRQVDCGPPRSCFCSDCFTGCDSYTQPP